MGVELIVGLALAFMVLGPKRMHSMLGHIGRYKAQFDKASQGIKAQLTAELEGIKPELTAKPATLAVAPAGYLTELPADQATEWLQRSERSRFRIAD